MLRHKVSPVAQKADLLWVSRFTVTSELVSQRREVKRSEHECCFPTIGSYFFLHSGPLTFLAPLYGFNTFI